MYFLNFPGIGFIESCVRGKPKALELPEYVYILTETHNQSPQNTHTHTHTHMHTYIVAEFFRSLSGLSFFNFGSKLDIISALFGS
jgi:hypothetical protein